MPEVVVVHAVDLPVDLVRTGPIERAEAANVVSTKPWFHGDQLGEIAAI